MYYGLDLHKEFIQISAVSAAGKEVKSWKIVTKPDAIEEFASDLKPEDQVVMETTFHTWSVYALIKESFDGRVVVANSIQVKAIAHARVKTDKVDARILAQLLRLDFVPEVQAPDQETQRLRELAKHRKMLSSLRGKCTNGIRAVLNKKLLDHPKWLFQRDARKWLASQEFNEHERLIVDNYLELYEQIEQKMERVDAALTERAKEDQNIRLLMTIPGVSLTTATGIYAAIGDVERFESPDKLAAYFGLTPSISQSAASCYHGRITKTGTNIGRWLAVEAANSLVLSGTPLSATYFRVRRKKGHNVAVVAIARKIIVVCWHLLKNQQPYRYTTWKRSTREKLGKVTPNYKPGNRYQSSKTIEEFYLQIGLPSLTVAPKSEKKVAATNKRVVTLGRKHFKHDEIDTRNYYQKLLAQKSLQ